MERLREVGVSVGAVVEHLFRSGDILPGRVSVEAFVEGGRAHREVQSDRGDDYQAEVALESRVSGDHCTLVLSGRADGIDTSSGVPVIEEIKSTERDVDSFAEDEVPRHWAQATLYACMLARRDDLDLVGVRLVYYQRGKGNIRRFERLHDIGQLDRFWEETVGRYLVWADRLSEYRNARDGSVAALGFPFASFRRGQKAMVERVYEAIREREQLFLQAPTGIGKTIGVLYPAVKAVAHGHLEKVFYLTAKTITRSVAEQAVRLLGNAGAELKSVTITAKSKICFLRDRYPDQPPCDPEICRYARGHFTRVGAATDAAFESSIIDRGVVESIATEYTVCPFELSLDLAWWADIVIGDYNYAFDPRVRLQRFFEYGGKRDFLILVDEAHNLVDRGRAMYSATLDKQRLLRVRREIKRATPDIETPFSPMRNLYRCLGALNTRLLDLRKRIEDPESATPLNRTAGAVWVGEEDPPLELAEPARDFLREFETCTRTRVPIPEPLLQCYFEVYAFVRVLGWWEASASNPEMSPYLTLFRVAARGLTVELACIDPSPLLAETLKTSAASVLFSATLEPISYFTSLLGGRGDREVVSYDSPFPREHLMLLVDPTIPTVYRKRGSSYEPIARRILDLVSSRPGNYLLYFPSYAYAEEVRLRFAQLERLRRGTGESPTQRPIEVVVQTRGLSEDDRDAFLARFQPQTDRILVGFVVMGGIFAEGIDLEGERLTGAVVVGPGLPQIGPERDLIKHYFDERTGGGFDYAFTYPGFNRVQQAAGRVIRTEADRGVVLLIGERFGHDRYRELFPPEWHNPVILDAKSDLPALLTEFWC